MVKENICIYSSATMIFCVLLMLKSYISVTFSRYLYVENSLLYQNISHIEAHIYLKTTVQSSSMHIYLAQRIGLLEFEDTKEVIIIRILKKNRQHNGQKEKYKTTNSDLQNMHIKLKIE